MGNKYFVGGVYQLIYSGYDKKYVCHVYRILQQDLNTYLPLNAILLVKNSRNTSYILSTILKSENIKKIINFK
jgi:hypothetical protein